MFRGRTTEARSRSSLRNPHVQENLFTQLKWDLKNVVRDLRGHW